MSNNAHVILFSRVADQLRPHPCPGPDQLALSETTLRQLLQKGPDHALSAYFFIFLRKTKKQIYSRSTCISFILFIVLLFCLSYDSSVYTHNRHILPYTTHLPRPSSACTWQPGHTN